MISSGGPVVSKKLKSYLRKAGDIFDWRIGYEKQIIDTFQQVTNLISSSSEEVYNALSLIENREKNSDFRMKWLNANETALNRRDEIRSDIPFSDCKVFDIIMTSLPESSIVELGNSSVIRYSQILMWIKVLNTIQTAEYLALMVVFQLQREQLMRLKY